MYHGIPLDYHLFVFVFAILAWLGRTLYKGYQQISRQIKGVTPNLPTPSLQQQGVVEAPSQAAAQAQPSWLPPQMPFPTRIQALPAGMQTLPVRAEPLTRLREIPRRPEAGGPAVPREATEDDLRRQERDLFASEASGLKTPLADNGTAPGPPVQALFGGPDDLVRAIILQEVLGPPLSRRSTAPRPTTAPSITHE